MTAPQQPSQPPQPGRPHYPGQLVRSQPAHPVHAQPAVPAPYVGGPTPPHPGYPAPPPVVRKPNGATAIIAGVLAILCAVWNVMVAVSQLEKMDVDGRAIVGLQMFTGSALGALAFLAGAVLLFAKRSIGRILIAVATVLMTITYMVSVLLFRMDGAPSDVTVLWILVVLTVPFIATALALLPATGRWCRRPAQGPQRW